MLKLNSVPRKDVGERGLDLANASSGMLPSPTKVEPAAKPCRKRLLEVFILSIVAVIF